MIINKETMRENTLMILERLFQLPEIDKIAIKDIVIPHICEEDVIQKALASCHHDVMSDVDFRIWITVSPEDFKEESPIYKRFFKRLDIEKKIFGVIFQPREGADKEGLRIVLQNGYRMDITCYVRQDAARKSLPKQEQRRYEGRKQEGNLWEDWEQDKANEFWFCAVQALAKLLRNDYLIADHLSHMLIMEGLVVQMVDRDNRFKTNFHRYGYSEQLKYRMTDLSFIDKYKREKDGNFNYIAENLCRAIISYDELVAGNNPLYEKRAALFFRVWDAYLT